MTDSVLTENKISCSEMPYENSYKTLCTFLPFLLYQIHKNKNNHHRDEEVNYFVFIHGLILPVGGNVENYSLLNNNGRPLYTLLLHFCGYILE